MMKLQAGIIKLYRLPESASETVVMLGSCKCHAAARNQTGPIGNRRRVQVSIKKFQDYLGESGTDGPSRVVNVAQITCTTAGEVTRCAWKNFISELHSRAVRWNEQVKVNAPLRTWIDVSTADLGQIQNCLLDVLLLVRGVCNTVHCNGVNSDWYQHFWALVPPCQDSLCGACMWPPTASVTTVTELAYQQMGNHVCSTTCPLFPWCFPL